ncbi:MAG TPA: hypothetical protein VIU40_04555 [Geobacteraceae bacterium]
MATKHGGPETRREEAGNNAEKGSSSPETGPYPRTDPVTGRPRGQTLEGLVQRLEGAYRDMLRLRTETDRARETFQRLQGEVMSAETRCRALAGDIEDMIMERAKRPEVES